MYLNMVWCYVFILTLLDISLNTRLTAQGKSHGITVHDQWRLIEKVHFQEYAKDEQPVPPESLRLSPPALDFGRAELARPTALTVTITNTANTTMHLASVAGTTPHFHASFFESKTLPPQANTTFSVVFLGRREGLVSAQLYIHTSLGVHKYPVSAEGVGNEFDVWPIIGVRVPLNASLEPLLTMRNPTDHTIQVTEIYSSSAWLGLQLPDGGLSAPRELWSLAPHSTAGLVRLRMHAPPTTLQPKARAYIRIKANITGGGLVVAVEARMTSQQEFLDPLQLRLRVRGSRDPPESWDILAGSSSATAVPATARSWGARCASAPFSPRHPLDEPVRQANGAVDTAHGVKSEGVHVSLLRPQFDAFQPPTPSVRFTLDFAKMWDSFVTADSPSMNGLGAAGAVEEAWCAGFVRVGRSAMPYSVRLLAGGLALLPPQLQFITANKEEVMQEREVRARNDFKMPVRLLGLQYDEELARHFYIEETTAARGVVRSGQTVTVARLALRSAPDDDTQLSAQLRVLSDIAAHALPVRVSPGRFRLEWEWPHSEDGTLRLGTLGTSSTRRVQLVLHNTGPGELCVRQLSTELPGAQLALTGEGERAQGHNNSRCVCGGGSLRAELTLVAPARAGNLTGEVVVRSEHAVARAVVTLSARAGTVRAAELCAMQGAPFAPASVAIQLHSSMSARMRVTHVTLPSNALSVTLNTELDITTGKQTVGTLAYSPERLCETGDCYTGLDLETKDGTDWLERLDAITNPDATPTEIRIALELDCALLARRLALFTMNKQAATNTTLYVHTTEVVQIPVPVALFAVWPRLALRGAGGALCGVGSTLPLRVGVYNPSSRPLLLHAALAEPLAPEISVLDEIEGWEERPQCIECAWSSDTFTLSSWRAVKGDVRLWRGERDERAQRGNSSMLPPLLLAPGAELELLVNFTPKTAAPLMAKLYIRNNLTMIESVHVWGHGVYPSFELAGRRPGRHSPLMFEVTECGDSSSGALRRSIVARNTGRVAVTLRSWRLAGGGCTARGFRLSPCAPLTLAPNESRALTLAFAPDWSLARVPAMLEVTTDMGRAEFALAARIPARLLPACAAAAPRPPFEPALRAAGTLLALAALVLVLAAAALDAERELRRARAARPQVPPARAPLDLRGVTADVRPEDLVPRPTPPPAPPQPTRRKRASRRVPVPLDPQAERRAFERWRAEVLRRADDDDHSSEDADAEPDAETDSTPPPEAPEPDEPPEIDDTEIRPPEREREFPPQPDEDVVSTGSDSSSPGEERDEPEEPDDVEDSSTPTAPTDEGREPETEARSTTAADTQKNARTRRSSSPPPRRSERSRADGDASRTRAPPRHHVRKDKTTRRRGTERERSERTTATPPRTARDTVVTADVRAPAALRRGATWSSVVAEGVNGTTTNTAPVAPLAPIGSDVRRRAEAGRAEGLGAQSLFYFNESPPPVAEPGYSWHAQSDAFNAPVFREDNHAVGGSSVGGTGYGSIGSVWGSGGAPLSPRAPPAWLWGGDVRPPPGFGAPARPAARTYDPFHSLASIWGPGTMDWRREPNDPQPPEN